MMADLDEVVIVADEVYVAAENENEKEETIIKIHFTVVNGRYKCNYCSKSYSMSASSSPLRHLRRDHQNKITMNQKTCKTVEMLKKKSFCNNELEKK